MDCKGNCLHCTDKCNTKSNTNQHRNCELKDEEIIKALELCNTQDGSISCYDCPCYDFKKDECKGFDHTDLLELINRLKAEIELKTMDIESLTNERKALEEMVAEQKAEIEKLRKIADNLRIANGEAYNSGFEIGKIIGRKEFVDKLKEKGRYIFPQIYYEAVGLKQRKIYTEEDIENTLKEMVGEHNV